VLPDYSKARADDVRPSSTTGKALLSVSVDKLLSMKNKNKEQTQQQQEEEEEEVEVNDFLAINNSCNSNNSHTAANQFEESMNSLGNHPFFLEEDHSDGEEKEEEGEGHNHSSNHNMSFNNSQSSGISRTANTSKRRIYRRRSRHSIRASHSNSSSRQGIISTRRATMGGGSHGSLRDLSRSSLGNNSSGFIEFQEEEGDEEGDSTECDINNNSSITARRNKNKAMDGSSKKTLGDFLEQSNNSASASGRKRTMLLPGSTTEDLTVEMNAIVRHRSGGGSRRSSRTTSGIGSGGGSGSRTATALRRSSTDPDGIKIMPRNSPRQSITANIDAMQQTATNTATTTGVVVGKGRTAPVKKTSKLIDYSQRSPMNSISSGGGGAAVAAADSRSLPRRVKSHDSTIPLMGGGSHRDATIRRSGFFLPSNKPRLPTVKPVRDDDDDDDGDTDDGDTDEYDMEKSQDDHHGGTREQMKASSRVHRAPTGRKVPPRSMSSDGTSPRRRAPMRTMSSDGTRKRASVRRTVTDSSSNSNNKNTSGINSFITGSRIRRITPGSSLSGMSSSLRHGARSRSPSARSTRMDARSNTGKLLSSSPTPRRSGRHGSKPRTTTTTVQ